MSRAVLLLVGVLVDLGCNPFGSGDTPSPDAGDAPVDVPMTVPASICKVDRLPIAAVPPLADLAITGTAEGYTALWVAPGALKQGHGMLLSPDHQLVASRVIPAITDSRLTGITDTGRTLLLSTGNGIVQTTWTLGRDLGSASAGPTLAIHANLHGLYPADAGGANRVFVTTTGTRLTASHIDDSGRIDDASTAFRDVTVLDLACADGPGHAHCAYAVNPISDSARCVATHVQLTPTIGIPDGQMLADFCSNLRVSSGPDGADSMLVTWTDLSQVHASYVGAGGLDVERTMPGTGAAPKVQFDGVRFWLAWIDDRDGLQLASFDVTGAIVQYSLTGWVPAGPEAFELVRRGNETALVMLSGAGLEFLTICS